MCNLSKTISKNLKEFNAKLGIPHFILLTCKPLIILDPLESWVQKEQKAWTTSCCFPVFSSGFDDFQCKQPKQIPEESAHQHSTGHLNGAFAKVDL